MNSHKTIVRLSVIWLVGLAGAISLRAQDRSDFTQLQTTLKVDDTVSVTTAAGDNVKGKMLEITPERIVLKVKGAPQTLAASQILKVKRRKNGVLLGALIGAGSMVPVSIAFASYAANEGGDSAAALLPIAIGLGIGTGIDALIPSQKTVYERNSKNRVSLTPVIGRKGDVGVKVGFNF
jgi:hypothetical protein